MGIEVSNRENDGFFCGDPVYPPLLISGGGILIVSNCPCQTEVYGSNGPGFRFFVGEIPMPFVG